MSAPRNDPAFALMGQHTKEELACMLLEARRLAERFRDECWDALPGACKDGITWTRGLDEESGPPYELPWEVEK